MRRLTPRKCRITAFTTWCGVALLLWSAVPQTSVAQAPSFEMRKQVLRSLVQVTAGGCADGTRRSGSGFLIEKAGRVVTAHHVVGGCSNIVVSYEAVPASGGKLKPARLVRVFSAGDLGLLEVADPPDVPVLQIASAPAPRGSTYAGFGYAHGVPTAGDQEVRFSTGSARLRDILPPDADEELRRVSPIATDREVLRFNVALQPGMSGGPIVNAMGEVIGVIAGGLKAGAAAASWGWPIEWVKTLVVSNEPVDRSLRVAGTFYTSVELDQLATARKSGRRLTCGGLEFVNTGRRGFDDLSRGADDQPRLRHILNLSRETPAAISQLMFDVWVHEASGATSLVPAGSELQREGESCIARSKGGPFKLIVWSSPAPTPADAQWRSEEFERRILGPQAPWNFFYQVDQQLTTMVMHPQTGMYVAGPQFRSNDMVFTRKGVMQAKRLPRYPNEVVPFAHTFETLVAKAGTFLGVGTVNDEVDPMLNACLQAASSDARCRPAWRHLHEWTHFVLATQLSTYPVF